MKRGQIRRQSGGLNRPSQPHMSNLLGGGRRANYPFGFARFAARNGANPFTTTLMIGRT